MLWFDFQGNLTLKWRNCEKVEKCSESCENQEIASDIHEIVTRCWSKFTAETFFDLISSAISLWIEETVQKLKSVQNYVKMKELPSDMNEIMTRCWSPFNAEAQYNLICSAISLWIEETVQTLQSVQNHVKMKELPSDMCGNSFE